MIRVSVEGQPHAGPYELTPPKPADSVIKTVAALVKVTDGALSAGKRLYEGNDAVLAGDYVFSPSYASGASTISREEIRNIVRDSLRTVSCDALAKMRRSVFLVKQSRTDKKGIGVGVFIGPTRAVTANHNLLADQKKVYATMPEIGKVLILTVVKRVKNLDYAVLACDGEHDYLEIYEGELASLPGSPLALCTFQIGIAEDLNDDDLADTFAHSIGVMQASGVKLSRHGHFLVYTSATWPGDSGGALVMHDGKLVGLHLDGVNHLKELVEHEIDDLPSRVDQLEASVKDVIRSVANGCVAVLASSFK